MTVSAKKGASPLHLDNTELRRELRRADVIIMTIVSMYKPPHQFLLESRLIDSSITKWDDPLAEDARLQAMYRTSPKPDYLKIAFFVLILMLTVSFIASQADNQRLRAQLAQVQGDRL